MKKYVKPQMIIEAFKMDESICTCTDVNTIARGWSIIPWYNNEWHEWNDDGDRIVQSEEIGQWINPEGMTNTSFVIVSGQDEGTRGTIIYTYWEGGPLTGHLNVNYRNAS